MLRFILIVWTILLYVGYSEANCNRTSTFMCPEGYCISIAKKCNGIKDCVGGEDEINCDEWYCPERSDAIAKANGYPCKKPCETNEECGGALKSCMCDDECGWSCYNADATCRDDPPIVQHSLQTIIYRRKSGMLEKFTGTPIYGCVAKYTCPDGWRLEGPMPRCTAKRFWSKLAPRCVSTSCQEPVPGIRSSTDYAFITNGKEQPKTSAAIVGTEVQYVCEDGLRLFGDLPKCGEDLRWTVTNAKCTVPCHDRENTPDVPCGTECDTDSDCPGEMKCYCDGPCGRSCTNTNVNCGNATTVASATLIYNNETGIERVARYTCDIGYYLAFGQSTLTCTGSGQWSGTPPVCKLVRCGSPTKSIEDTGGYVSDFTGLDFGSTLIFECNRRKYHQYGSESRTCMQNGRWSGLLAICDEIDDIERCPHPGVPINGRLINNEKKYFKVGQTVKFQCDEGYVMYGPNNRTCLWTKEWTEDRTPTCEDPKYHHSSTDVIASLRKSLSTLPDQKTSIGRSINANSNRGQEVYFLFDISGSVLKKPNELKQEFEFAKRLVERLGEFNGYLNYGIMVFALSNVTALDITTDIANPTKPDRVIEILDDVYQKAISHQYEKRAKLGTNTHVALEKLRNMISFAKQQEKMKDNKRHVFVFTDGKHTDGNDPREIRKSIQNEFGNSIEFYSITACTTCKSKKAQEELIGLASNPDNYVYIKDIYKLTNYLDQVTNVTIDFSICGQAGNVQSIKKQASPLSLGRSINAEDATEDGWPWQALITLRGTDREKTLQDGNILGGGSILNRKWILTAAHVFKDDEQVGDWKRVYAVSVGVFERPKVGESAISSIQIFSMADYIEHEEFNKISFANDIALIKLGPELNSGMEENMESVDGIEYGYYTRPVCLPCKGTCITEKLLGKNINDGMSAQEKCLAEEKLLLTTDAKVVATGFGHQDKVRDGFANVQKVFNPPEKLQQALLRIASVEECKIGEHEINNEAGEPLVRYTEKMICCMSGDPKKIIDTCQGDSGGPVVREVRDLKTGESCWTQIGIVSFGWGCGQDLPGYYTNVARYVSWIDEKMKT